jgi:hypothetical protein
MSEESFYRLETNVYDGSILIDPEAEFYEAEVAEAYGKKQIVVIANFSPPLAIPGRPSDKLIVKSFRSPLISVVGPQEIQKFTGEVEQMIKSDPRTVSYRRHF